MRVLLIAEIRSGGFLPPPSVVEERDQRTPAKYRDGVDDPDTESARLAGDFSS
jgi:hypothetical protein